MRPLTRLAVAAACATAASAQTPRPSFNLDQGGAAIFDPMIATHGDRSVALYSAGDSALGQAHIVAQRSDGRGLSWTAPAVQVDQDGAGARKDIDDPCYVQFGSGTNVYAVWEDLRSGNTEPYFASSNDGGATWNAEIALPFGFASGAGAVRTDLRLAVAPGSPDKVYVSFASDSLSGPDTLFLVSSLDGGATFGPAVPVNGGADVDFLDIRASGSTVHIAFDDERVTAGIDDVYYNRSSDGGVTFDFGIGVVIDGAGGAGNNQDRINLTLDGTTVAVGWAAEETGLDEEYRAAVSTATSTDGGATWAEQPGLGIGGFPRVSNTGSSGEHGVAISWTGGALPEDTLAITSIDHGLSFSAAFPVNDTTGDADFAEVKWNDLYNNFISVWMSDDIGATNHAYVGGFRPQTLTANGWVAGATVVNFSCARFDPTGNVAWALVNLSGPGTLILADGRNLGLLADPLLFSSVQLAVLGVASSPISGSGSGATPPVPIVLPPGLALWAVGAGIDTSSGAVVDITDVQKIEL